MSGFRSRRPASLLTGGPSLDPTLPRRPGRPKLSLKLDLEDEADSPRLGDKDSDQPSIRDATHFRDVTQSGTLSTLRGSLSLTAQGMGNVPWEELQSEGSLGAGAHGSVRCVRDRRNGNQYALKLVRVSDDEAVRKNIYRELKACSVSNRFIVTMHDTYFNEGSVFILFELMGLGHVKELMLKAPGKRLAEHAVGLLAIDMLRGLDHLHRISRMIHRDIKPQNILLNRKGVCKLSDFGVASAVLKHDEEAVKQSFVGTLSYMAPERIQSKAYGPASDIWSFGLTLMELLTGAYPYTSTRGSNGGMVPGGVALTFWDALKHIVQDPPPQLNSKYSDHCREFVSACLQKDPAKRPSAAELLQFRWAQRYLKRERAVRAEFRLWLDGLFPLPKK
eukprot:gnl/Dysnectes_brevis/3891_a5034_833.p1 GENE.gnl/Dysnectes_brevis/3891_a5034_833~~gnl/Dysnectes_brevis/3891_a5034_833.p1  ORF type:complete len:391 (-),score=87.01 gnl/Dysnectes_brevis/3891_a5034_833:196-1368(-)